MYAAEAQEGAMLRAGDPEPVGVRNGGATSPFLIICDHAGRTVPQALHDLGLAAADLARVLIEANRACRPR